MLYYIVTYINYCYNCCSVMIYIHIPVCRHFYTLIKVLVAHSVAAEYHSNVCQNDTNYYPIHSIPSSCTLVHELEFFFHKSHQITPTQRSSLLIWLFLFIRLPISNFFRLLCFMWFLFAKHKTKSLFSWIYSTWHSDKNSRQNVMKSVYYIHINIYIYCGLSLVIFLITFNDSGYKRQCVFSNDL